MELIDKYLVVSYIKNKIDKILKNQETRKKLGALRSTTDDWVYLEFKVMLNYINSLKIKKVDLEKEKDDYWNELCDDEFGELLERDVKWFDDIAKYFFELGLKVQKGE